MSRDRFKSLWAGSIVAKSIAICSSVLLNNLFYINVHLFIVFISCVIGASLSEPHCYVVNRGEAQCIMVRTYTELFYSD